MTRETPISDRALQRLLGYRLRRAWIAVRSDLRKTLTPFDLRMLTYTALVLIEANPGLSQAQLAALMDVERPNLVAIIDELSRRGLVYRRRATQDRRAYALTLTPEGQSLCGTASQAVRRHEERQFGALSATDRHAVETALALIADRA